MKTTRLLLVLFWLIVGSVYLLAGLCQSRAVNLSATAGGQQPYLDNARKMNDEGGRAWYGDHNRMPLVPIWMTLFDSDGPAAFARQASLASLALSIMLLLVLGLVAHRLLPVWEAGVLTLFAVVCVFPAKASFVQAELPFYCFFLLTWLLMCQVLDRPQVGIALLAGITAGLTFWVKASVLPLLLLFLITGFTRSVFRIIRTRAECRSIRSGRVDPRRLVACVMLAAAAFVIVTGPYLRHTRNHFGRWFYNVNSTFFMWCDSWNEAQALNEQFDLAERFPPVPREELPGPQRYLRTHSWGQIFARLGSGYALIGRQVVNEAYIIYPLVLLVTCAYLIRRRRRFPPGRLDGNRHAVLFFSVASLLGYLTLYAWYAPVAYGDRFVLSLMLPLMFGLLWWGRRLAVGAGGKRIAGRRVGLWTFVLAGLTVLLCGQGILVAARCEEPPHPHFVNFYFRETDELRADGRLAEARLGFEGVVQLEPEHAAAWRALGYIALRNQEPDRAIEHVRKAIRLEPGFADAHNSLGSALVLQGKPEQAAQAFLEAVRLNPNFAVAWYNLGDTFLRMGALEEARSVIERLRALKPSLADQLQQAIDGRSPPP